MSEKLKETGEKTYLPPLYSALVAGKAKYTGMSKSAVIADAVKKSFDEMLPQNREYLLNANKLG